MEKELSNEEIIAMYELQDTINKKFYEDKYYGFDLDLDSFFLRCRPLKTQIYGLRVQAFLSTRLKYKTTPSSEDCGDFKTRENEDVEFKCSFIDNFAKQINVKQIRQFQDIDWYYIFTVNYNDYRNIIYKLYKLSKKQMTEEMIIMNAQPIHSTKKQNEANEKVEYGFSIKLNSEHFKRWEDNYLNKKFDLRKLNEEALEELKNVSQIKKEIETYKQEIERLKVDHPEEIAKRQEKINEIINDWKDKKKIVADKLIAKRRKAFDKIPKEIINNILIRYEDKEINKDYLHSLIDFEITKRFTRRKRKTKPVDQSLPINILCHNYYTKQYSYEEFCKLFKKRWTFIHTEEYEEQQINESEEYKEVETQDENYERMLEKERQTSFY